ncbi:hypothetical protein QOL99_02500 [Deinococcus sp. MIMF12]|uniref:Uncharacterized protein n=1 Tax=Deinococcus rhizophilus TaxID=3049544 RepID=A0ABT7JD91_9DEIO|nr:hypothetical protein [Deinococcus rhizophilus]MDL2343015.1 hypothetical protein [Deinococcus rhizophilus]
MSSIKKPITPVVEAIGRLSITGNTIPHVWYQRSEFRSDANRPDRNMITIVSDIVYWYRPREVRNEEEGGIFVGYERKFARDKLQYNYERRGAVFGMSDREVSDACNRAQKKGLLKIEYRTERIKGKLLHNIVYIELIPEAIAATLAGPNVGPVVKAKGAKRGRHVKAGDPEAPTAPVAEAVFAPADAGVDDEGEELDLTDDQAQEPGGEDLGTSLNSGGLTSLNLEDPGTEFRDTYNESSPEISSSREFRGGAQDVTGDAHAQEAQPTTAPEAEPTPPLPSSSESAARLTAEGTPATITPGALITPPATVAGVAVLEPPVGGAADAAEERPTPSLDKIRELFERQIDQATGNETVPGGGAAVPDAGAEAPSGDGEAASSPSVDDLAPIPAAELSSRVPAGPESPAYKAMREVLGNSLPEWIGERTRTGQILRSAHWILLTEDEVRQVTAIAQAEAERNRDNMHTLFARGLDRLVGAVKLRGAVPTDKGRPQEETKVIGPVDLSHLDPNLSVGQRCTVGGALGIVLSNRANGYVVDLDSGERVTVDRAAAGQLTSLRASDAPAPRQIKGEDRHAVGARWRCKSSGNEVQIVGSVQVQKRNGPGLQFKLSDNRQLTPLDLMLKYEFVRGA